MPPKKKPDSRLLTLRQICRVTQPEFARVVGLAFDTIQSAETGRLSLSPTIMEHVRHGVGAVWSDESGIWMLDRHIRKHILPEGADPETPFSTDLYRRFQALKANPPSPQRQLEDRHLMQAWLNGIFDRIPPARWVEYVQRFAGFLELIEKEFPAAAVQPELPAKKPARRRRKAAA
jgi:DNA-binding XRE family transcriptional regulator